jgi:hypothetical protein
MRRSFILINFLFLAALVFAQQNSAFRIIGGLPDADDNKLYLIQVGAFKNPQNADKALERLMGASLNPSYERHNDLTRVMIKGIPYRELPLVLDKMKSLRFGEVIVRVDRIIEPVSNLPPVSTAVVPSRALREIANRTVKIGETRNLTDLVTDRNVEFWTSSTPGTIAVDTEGTITGLKIGSGYIQINENDYISIAVIPQEAFYVVPESEAAMLPPDSRTGDSSSSRISEYRTEPTFRLSYRFNNKGETRGASGGNGGIDILGRGSNYRWLWTTYEQGGWFYDLNGVRREMINGYQKSANGVELTIKPEFVYDNGVPYLQLRHLLRNTGNLPVSGQRFGASADVMIHDNDFASLYHTPYGAYMTDSESNPSIQLLFIGEGEYGVTPVDTLWLGTWNSGGHLNHIYDDNRSDIHYSDSAIAFSYKDISLEAGETKEYIIRFTLARNED